MKSVLEDWKFELIPNTHSKLLRNFNFIGEQMLMKMEIGTTRKVKMYNNLCNPFKYDLCCATLCGADFVFKREKRAQRRSYLKRLQCSDFTDLIIGAMIGYQIFRSSCETPRDHSRN